MERITAMNNRIQLLMVLKYIMEKSAESNPITNADIIRLHHFIQSIKLREVTPEETHQIGV